MAEPLATSDDVVERLGRALTTVEDARIDAVLRDVSAAVRSYTHQTFTEDTTTDLLPIRNGAVRLMQKPVTAVIAVEDGLGNALPYTWLDGDDRITLSSSGYLNEFEINVLPNSRVAKAAVTSTHGYDTTPDDVLGLVCHLAMRALGTPSTDAGKTSETITNYSYTIGSAAGSGPFGLLAEEKRLLDSYRVAAGPIYAL